MSKRKELLVFSVFLLIPVLLVEVKLPCNAVSSSGSANTPSVEVKVTSASLSFIHCKGAEFNVSFLVINRLDSNVSGLVEVDGWDPDTGLHVTSGTEKVELKAGEAKYYWIMLPIDTQEPKEKYYFNASFIPSVSGTPASACKSEGGVPLYKYLLLLISKG